MGSDLESRRSVRLILQRMLGQQQPDALHHRIFRCAAAEPADRDAGREPGLGHGRAIFDADMEFEQRHLVQRRRLCGERYFGSDGGDADSDLDLFNHLHGQRRLEHGEHHRDGRKREYRRQQWQAPRQVT